MTVTVALPWAGNKTKLWALGRRLESGVRVDSTECMCEQ